MFRAERGEVKVDISAEERRMEEPGPPIVREVGGRRAGFEASGVLFRLPIILLAMTTVGRVNESFFSEREATTGGC
jgi:hypothetical protein